VTQGSDRVVQTGPDLQRPVGYFLARQSGRVLNDCDFHSKGDNLGASDLEIGFVEFGGSLAKRDIRALPLAADAASIIHKEVSGRSLNKAG
jgi:hypothetical protein